MGLLDALFSGDSGSGGLLDFLRQNGLNQNTNTGIGPNDASYAQAGAPSPLMGQPSPIFAPQQASPLDNAQWPAGPIGAPSQANAQIPQQPPPIVPAQPQGGLPVPAPQAGPLAPAPQNNAPPQAPANPLAGLSSFLNRASDGLQSVAQGGTLQGAITGNYTDPKSQAAQVANVTAKALIAKGVDPQVAMAAVQPGNTEMLKTLVDANFKPKDPMNLGSGYILPPGATKATRLFTPDDKTPSGFVVNDDGSMHFAKGGPADPDYLRLKAAKEVDPNAVHVLGQNGELYKVDAQGNPTVVHKNQPSADSTLDDATTQAMADQYLAGDRSVLQNLGRGAQGAANVVKLRETITQRAQAAGIDPKGIVNNFNEQAGALAGQRSIGTRAANISLAANEANNMIPIALKASEAVPRTQYMPINQAIQAVQKGTSSPELARFVAATNSLVNSYVRAVSPSGVPTDSMREHAYSMLNAAQSHQAYQAVTSIMQDEMKAAMAAPGQVRKELRHEDSDVPLPAATAPPTGVAPKEGDIAHNPSTGETLIRKGGKWVPGS